MVVTQRKGKGKEGKVEEKTGGKEAKNRTKENGTKTKTEMEETEMKGTEMKETEMEETESSGMTLGVVFALTIITVWVGMAIFLTPAPSIHNMPATVLTHYETGVLHTLHVGKHRVRVFAAEGGEARPSSPGHGEVILLLHGVPGSSYSYRNVLPLLREAMDKGGRGGMRIVAPDFVGMGLSEKPEGYDYSWHGLADGIQAVVEALNVERVHLVVHDVSGPIGMEVAIEMAGKGGVEVASVTLLNTVLDLVHLGENRPFPMGWLSHSTPGVGAIMAAMTAQSPPLTWGNTLMFKLRGASSMSVADAAAYGYLLAYNQGTPAFLSIMDGFVATKDHQDALVAGMRKLADSGVPVQYVPISDDVIPDTHPSTIVSLLKLTRVVDPPLAAKHFVMEDAPAEVARVVAEFVLGVEASPPKPRATPMYAATGHGGHGGHGHGHGGHGHAGHGHGGHGHGHGHHHH